MKRPSFGITELLVSDSFDLSKATLHTRALNWKKPAISAPGVLGNYESAQKVIDPAFLIAHHLGLGEIRIRWTALGAEDEKRDQPPIGDKPPWEVKVVLPFVRRNSPYENFIWIKPALTMEAYFVAGDRKPKSYQLFSRRLKNDTLFCFANQTFWPNGKGNNPQNVRDTYDKDGIGQGQGVLLKYYHEEFGRQWPGMRDRAFDDVVDHTTRLSVFD